MHGRYLLTIGCNALSLGMVAISFIWWLNSTLGVLKASWVLSGAVLASALTSLLAGHWLDRHCKAKTLAYSALLCAFCLLVMVALMHYQVKHWLVWCLVYSAFSMAGSVRSLALTTLLRDIASSEQVSHLVRRRHLITESIELLAPLTAGALAYVATEISLLIIAGLQLMVFILYRSVRTAASTNVSAQSSVKVWQSIYQGAKLKWKMRLERDQLLVMALMNIMVTAFFLLLLPNLMRESEGNVLAYGVAQSAVAAGGWVTAAFGIQLLSRWLAKFYLCSLGLLLLSTGILGASFSHSWLFYPALFAAGFGLHLFRINGTSHRMLALPDRLRARLSSFDMTVGALTRFIGFSLTGALLQSFSTHEIVYAYGLMLLILAMLMLAIPGYKEFMSLSHEQVENFYARKYARHIQEQA
jgi:MFS family permease